jgi:hypothetical protein
MIALEHAGELGKVLEAASTLIVPVPSANAPVSDVVKPML